MKKIVVNLGIVFVLCILLLVMPSAGANVTATVSPSTVAPGDKIFINGTAEGQPQSVAIWILGKNFVNRDTVTVNVDGSFSYEINQATTKSLYSGQYFVVVQHPEMNGLYDIDSLGAYVYDFSGTTPVSLFKIWGPDSLQGFDAEEALVQGINKLYVDDSYTALQFQIVSSSVTATVSPSTVAQGDKIFINGTAEGQPSSVAIWILGKNFANRDTETVNVGGSFSYEVKQEVTKSLYSGQYFVVVQHPMMNGVYDIDICPTNPVGSTFVCDYAVGPGPVSVFKLSGPGSLQGSDAAAALVQGINRPYVDDTYTELQFQIVSPSKIGVYQNGAWYLDNDGSGTWNAGDRVNMFGLTGWTPVVGDWKGTGTSSIGVYKDGVWYLDYNSNGMFDTGDKVYSFGLSGWSPILGDWNGDGKTEIGVYKDGVWYLDSSGDGAYGPGDRANSYGLSGWYSVVGKWS